MDGQDGQDFFSVCLSRMLPGKLNMDGQDGQDFFLFVLVECCLVS